MSARARRCMDLGMIVLAVAAAVASQLEAGSPVRAVVVLAAFLLVPGWALVSLLSSGPPAAMIGLAVGLSLGIDVVGTLALLWSGRFNDAPVLTGFLGIVAVLLLIRDLLRQSRPSRVERPAPHAAS